MSGDNKDRYGYRHRSDSKYKTGESMPGDVGDSKGTFHDRAQKNTDVIVDGEVRSEDSLNRSSVEESGEQSSGVSHSGSDSTGSISQLEADGKVVEIEVESRGGTRETIAHYKNHQIHVEGGTPGETTRVKLKSGSGFMIGKLVSEG